MQQKRPLGDMDMTIGVDPNQVAFSASAAGDGAELGAVATTLAGLGGSA